VTTEPVERTPKGKVSPPGPAVISWSGLKRWEHCPQHHLRVIRKEVERSQMGRVFLPGTICDLVQRRWLESAAPQPGEMAEMVGTVFADVVAEGESVIKWRGNPLQDQQEVLAYCRQTVTTLEPWLVRNVLPYDYQPEVRFRAHMKVPYLCEGERLFGIVKMIGGIDIVVRDDQGKFRLYDLKTTKNDGYIRSTLAQLIFYDLAWGVIQGDFYHAVEWGFVTPALPEPYIPITVGREDRAAMLSRIIKYCHGVWADQWQPKADDDGCNWCEARGSCEKFREVPIVDENGKQRLSFTQAAAQRAQYRQ
jgi:hypothetical protein